MDTAQQVKERLDIVDFLRGYLNLSPAGKNLKANCPFHKEKTPSFMVSPERQMWHCFGCNIGGDIIAFLMRYENLEFVEALKILAEKAGIELSRFASADQKQLNVLYDINKAAKEFFKKNLGGAALDYLKSRGLKPETIAEFEIGFAEEAPDALSRHLANLGYAMPAIEKSGFTIKTERGLYRDRFRNRIMFPIFNHVGKAVGFTGRIMPGAESENIGKYVNSPETPVFNKSKLLYGFDRSKNLIREAKSAVLVEGQMDFLMSWQDGIKNLVATSGTALTGEHLRALKRVAENLVLAFDEDEAGRLATERAIDMAVAEDLAVKVMKVPADLAAKDPADIALSKPGALGELVAAAGPAMEYYFDRYRVRERKGDWKKNLRAILSKIKFVASPVERAHWLKEAAKMCGIEEVYLREEMEGLKGETSGASVGAEPLLAEAPALSRKELISQRIVALISGHPDLGDFCRSFLPHLPESYRAVAAYHLDPKSLSLAPELQTLADLTSLRAGLEIENDPARAKAELVELFRQMRLENVSEALRETHRLIEEQERAGRDTLELLSEKQKLAEEKRRLELEGSKVV